MRRTRRAWPHVVGGVALMVALASCSGSGDETPDQPRTSGRTADVGASATRGASQEHAGATPTQEAAAERRQRFQAQADCLNELGFPSTAGAEGVTTEISEGQDEAFTAATRQCRQEVDAQLGPDPAAAVLTEEQLGDEYDALLAVRECLVAAGYTVTEPPSRESWVASVLLVQDVLQEAEEAENRQMELPWSPYDGITSVDAMAQCPIS